MASLIINNNYKSYIRIQLDGIALTAWVCRQYMYCIHCSIHTSVYV